MHVENADGQGQLLIGERLSPISYHVAVEERDANLVVRVELQAPRDWLLKQGFKRHATLVLASGDRVEIKRDSAIDVSDSLSIVLEAGDLVYRESRTLLTAFPELRAADKTGGTRDENQCDPKIG